MTSIYVIAADPAGPVKLGFSKNPEKRLKQLQTGYPDPLTLFHVEPIGEANVRLMEGLLHNENRHRKMKGEWFRLSVEDAVFEVKHAVIRYMDSAELKSRRKL